MAAYSLRASEGFVGRSEHKEYRGHVGEFMKLCRLLDVYERWGKLGTDALSRLTYISSDMQLIQSVSGFVIFGSPKCLSTHDPQAGIGALTGASRHHFLLWSCSQCCDRCIVMLNCSRTAGPGLSPLASLIVVLEWYSFPWYFQAWDTVVDVTVISTCKQQMRAFQGRASER